MFHNALTIPAALLDEFLVALRAMQACRGFPVQDVILFGSHRWGGVHPHSDLDVLISLKVDLNWRTKAEFQRELEAEAFAWWGERPTKPSRVDFAILCPRDLALANHPLAPYKRALDALVNLGLRDGGDGSELMAQRWWRYHYACLGVASSAEVSKRISHGLSALVDVHYVTQEVPLSAARCKGAIIEFVQQQNCWLSDSWRLAYESLMQGTYPTGLNELLREGVAKLAPMRILDPGSLVLTQPQQDEWFARMRFKWNPEAAWETVIKNVVQPAQSWAKLDH